MRRACLLFLMIATFAAIAQQPSSRAELERKRQNILASIRQSQDELAATKKDKNATLAQLRALQAKLDARLSLIANINQEISSISGTIQESSKEVGHLRGSLEGLKLRYAQSVRYAYANRSSYNMLAFLFSATTYNDAMRRMKYLKRYRDYRKQQAEEIRTTQNRIEHKIEDLNLIKTEKDQLLTAQEQQRRTLMQETNEKGAVVNELKGREKELTASIEKNRKAQRQVEKAVSAIIAREIEAQRRKAAEEARKREEEERRVAAAAAARNNANNGNSYGSGSNRVTLNTGSGSRPMTANNNAGNRGSSSGSSGPSSSSSGSVTGYTATPRRHAAPTARELSMTPEAIALSNSFSANRGRLPWPVDRGVVTSGFGRHKHPVVDVQVDNLGIDIQASPGAAVRAVFDGTVTSTFNIPGAGVGVMITHGDYFTVYTNLASASVRKGDVVHTKQAIGTVGTNDEGQPMINFQVWKASGKTSVNMNPAGWIAN